MNKYLKIIALFLIILSSLLVEISGFSIMLGASYPYIIKPLIWIFIMLICLVFFKDGVIPNKKYKKEIDFYIVIATLIYFMVYFFLGYAKGFANNPYDHSIMGILNNLWSIIPIIIAKEYVRCYLVNNCPKKNLMIWALFISILFVITELNIYKFSSYFVSNAKVFELFMEIMVPSVIKNMFLTYISYYAGWGSCVFYSLLPQLAIYILPILPNINDVLLASLDSIVPFFTYVFINYKINYMDKTLDRRTGKVVDFKGWLVMVLVLAVIIAFGIGAFPYSPLVIASNSMAPKIHRGDIVILKKVDPLKLNIGDVIKYQMDGYTVVHRIKEIKKDEDDNLEFIMKGDNNNSIDLYPVKEQQVLGIVKFNIPYAGYPTLWITELMNPSVGDSVKVDKGRN